MTLLCCRFLTAGRLLTSQCRFSLLIRRCFSINACLCAGLPSMPFKGPRQKLKYANQILLGLLLRSQDLLLFHDAWQQGRILMVGRDQELDKRLVAVLDNLLATIDKDKLIARENRQLTMVQALLLSTAVTSQGTNLLVWAFCNIYNAIFETRAVQGN